MFEYNTQRERLKLKEYGRNIQKLAGYIRGNEDKGKRNQYAETLVELMKQISPSAKSNIDSDQKIWDDLFIIADFNLDVESPFPIPERDILNRKPLKLKSPSNDIRYKHYGKNMELLVEKAIELKDPEERENAIIYIGKLMKSFYATWNKDMVEDEAIIKNITTLSKGELKIDLAKVKENNLFEVLYKEKRPQNRAQSHIHGRSRKNQKPNYGKRKRY